MQNQPRRRLEEDILPQEKVGENIDGLEALPNPIQRTVHEDRGNANQTTTTFRVLSYLLVAMGAGLGAILLFSLQAASLKQGASIVSVGTMIALVAAMLGGLLGFLFGVPRTISQKDEMNTQEYKPNTNLELISDWLTKILVGVGLTQLVLAPEKLNRLANFLAVGLGNYDSSSVFGIAIVMCYLIGGFLVGFLWTRLTLGEMFAVADFKVNRILRGLQVQQKGLQTQQRELAEQVTELQMQQKKDKRAIDMARMVMERSSRNISTSTSEIKEVFSAARPIVLLDLFDKARELRRSAWREEIANSWKIERTLPIFEILAGIGPEDIPHRACGELGFGRKDILLAFRFEASDISRPEEQRPPHEAWLNLEEWRKAKDALQHAIQLRKNQGANVGHLYEVNRAICSMMLDANFRAGFTPRDYDLTAGAPTQDREICVSIMGDLEYAIDERHFWIFDSDERKPVWMIEHLITRWWMELNEAILTDKLKEQLCRMRSRG